MSIAAGMIYPNAHNAIRMADRLRRSGSGRFDGLGAAEPTSARRRRAGSAPAMAIGIAPAGPPPAPCGLRPLLLRRNGLRPQLSSERAKPIDAQGISLTTGPGGITVTTVDRRKNISAIAAMAIVGMVVLTSLLGCIMWLGSNSAVQNSPAVQTSQPR